ncbi:hypothetical protein WJX74_003195 [Apatococcus lobatus]|uniref:Uncharacterized protein n=1 Tax=Apatococcus lobatus TaxID=904363 RepID=A0AAW1Q733_9CHLO
MFSGTSKNETQQGKQKEVGVRGALDSTTARMLNIPTNKKPDAGQAKLLEYIRNTFDLSDFTPMNSTYGPISGMAEWERLIRAHALDLLRIKDTGVFVGASPDDTSQTDLE